MTTLPTARVINGGEGGLTTTEGSERPRHIIELAPRAVPMSLVARLMFGGWISGFGWAFAAFGMVFALIFVPRSMPDFTSYDATATGQVRDIEKTSMSENDDAVLRVHYTFEDSAGRTHDGVSYTTDSVEPASERSIEYTRANPDVSRIRGMRHSPFSPIALIVLVFPIVGLALASRGLVRGLRAARLLRRGVETTGKIVDIAPTKMTVQHARIMRATVEFQVGERTHRTAFNFPEGSAPALDGVQRLVYDPEAPSRASTLDDLPGRPRITPDGKLHWTHGSAALVLLAPIAFAVELALVPLVF